MMTILRAETLKTYNKYDENKLKLKIVHFCPLDGKESDPKCKRIIITTDCSSQQSIPTNDKHLVIVFYSGLAKTPFKKSALKFGQIFTVQRFETTIMPKDKVFKSNGQILNTFYDALVLVKPEFDPIIKMLVSLREEPFTAVGDSDSFPEDNQMVSVGSARRKRRSVSSDSTGISLSVTDEQKIVNTSVKKKLRFEEMNEELDIHLSSDDDFNETPSRQTRNISSQNRINTTKKRQSNENQMVLLRAQNQSNNSQLPRTPSRSQTSNTSSRSPTTSTSTYEYKTLKEIHSLIPVSGKTYCHTYGIIQSRDYKRNTIQLRDEKVFSITISLRPGKSDYRHYPASRTGDIIRIHRLLLPPNSMEFICSDPKDVVICEGFQDSEAFSPIYTSINPTFDDFDRKRKRELEEWFSDELLNDSLSQKKANDNYSIYTDICLQVIRLTTLRERTYLAAWDTTRPAQQTYKRHVSTEQMSLTTSEEELVRIINEDNMSIVVTAFEEHSNACQILKPFDFVVLFNVCIKADKYNKDSFTYTMSSGYTHGRCLRVVKRDSVLGQKFYNRIEEYKVMSAVNVAVPSIEESFPSQSLPSESQDINMMSTFMTTNESMFSEMPDFDVNLDEIVDVLENEESYLPVTRIVDIPTQSVTIEEMITNTEDKRLYKVKARVINHLTPNDKNDIICLLCTNQECHQLKTLRQAISDDPLIESIIQSAKDRKLLLNCFKCKQSSCVLVFKMILILEDNKRDKLIVQLFGHNAELFFRATPEEILRIDIKWHFVEKLLNYICAKIASIDFKHSNNVLNYWVLQPSKVDNRDEYIYQVRTAVAIETQDKCVGLNLLNK
ncbi:uncharacterized protein LOC128960967 [Oppia nitens]|uniref:uncharacterized protein LOC128960967 n=1 Tax=Oppia nitens TaxID=1686743 RepID=UPI0023DBB46E|nr:uncharacterized protein LOC128960967 [Oppia nitens]